MGRGQLRIYLGAAPGVGKTYAMLGEGRRRRSRGTDVVVAWVETHGRAETAAQIADLEVLPPALLRHRGVEIGEMDLDAVLARHPEVALVDELAHTNAPGSRNAKRWQDVAELLDAGIDVISTVNIQHLESLNDVVEAITGVRQRETVPDEVVRSAHQVELVDLTAEALRQRMAHGNVYGADKVDAALANYFRPGNLSALRELALLWVADRVDEALADYRTRHEIATPWETRERVLVAITGRYDNAHIIRRAARIARRSHAELVGVHVAPADGRPAGGEDHLAGHRRLLADVGGTYHELVAADPAAALAGFARSANVTQLVVGASQRSRWEELLRGSFVNDVIRTSGGTDVHVISPRGDGSGARLAGQRRRPWPAVLRSLVPAPVLPARRRAAGWLLASAGTLCLAAVLTHTRSSVDQAGRLLLFQLVVLAAAAVGGTGPAVTASILAAALLNWFFTPPIHTWTVASPADLLGLVLFLSLGLAVGVLVNSLASRSSEAARGRAEAEALGRVAVDIATLDEPLPVILGRMVDWLGLDGAAVTRDGVVVASAGAETAAGAAGTTALAMPEGELLVRGSLTADRRRLLTVFASHVSAALEQRRLREAAAGREVEDRADALRVALLRAVSHDLRTPLASIKAAATSLLDDDVVFTPSDRAALLEAIDAEVDRLDRVVANLLDASRLGASAVAVHAVAVDLDDLVPALLRSAGWGDAGFVLDVAPGLPAVLVDPGLLERVLANLISNALRVCPAQDIRVAASALGSQVELRVVDHGPGVEPAQHELLFEPFQRLGDGPGSDGVGLGLSVARGLVEAMGGRLTPETTPGGGMTMVVALPVAPGAGITPDGEHGECGGHGG